MNKEYHQPENSNYTGDEDGRRWELEPSYGVDPSGDTTLDESGRGSHIEGGEGSPEFVEARDRLQCALLPIVEGLLKEEDAARRQPSVNDPEYNDFY